MLPNRSVARMARARPDVHCWAIGRRRVRLTRHDVSPRPTPAVPDTVHNSGSGSVAQLHSAGVQNVSHYNLLLRRAVSSLVFTYSLGQFLVNRNADSVKHNQHKHNCLNNTPLRVLPVPRTPYLSVTTDTVSEY